MAMGAETVNVYKAVTINTASQGKLIIMLFDGAIRRAEESIRQMEKNNVELVHKNLIRAQEIITELRSSLNMEIGGEIARNLDKIYEYIHYLLVQGNMKKDAKPVRESIEYMRILRDTWKEAFEIYEQNRQAKLEEKDPSKEHQPPIHTSGLSLSI